MTEEETNKKLDILKKTLDEVLIFTHERVMKKITQMDNELAKINNRLDELENKKPKEQGLAKLE